MSVKYFLLCTAAMGLFTIGAGCKPKDSEADAARQPSGPSPEQIAATIEALTKGMRRTSLPNLNNQHIGKECVVVAATPDAGARPKGSPPPLGMVRRMGETTIYQAEIEDVSSDTLTIRAAYPSSGEYKIITISKGDIESIHLAG
jgi:hypothetical protein